MKENEMEWARRKHGINEKWVQSFGREGKRPHGRNGHRCKDDIKMYLRETGCEYFKQQT
jgi:hypothetical protein